MDPNKILENASVISVMIVSMVLFCFRLLRTKVPCIIEDQISTESLMIIVNVFAMVSFAITGENSVILPFRNV
jgi:hypothetical protein